MSKEYLKEKREKKTQIDLTSIFHVMRSTQIELNYESCCKMSPRENKKVKNLHVI